MRRIAARFDGMQKDYRRVDDDIFFADPPFGELAAFAARLNGGRVKGQKRHSGQIRIIDTSDPVGEAPGHGPSVEESGVASCGPGPAA